MRKRRIEERLARIEDKGKFDRDFWRRAGHEARFAASWEMVVEAELIRGKTPCELRLVKSVERLFRREQ